MCLRVLQSNVAQLLFSACKCHACKFMSDLFMFVFPDRDIDFYLTLIKKALTGCLGSSAWSYFVWLHFTAMAVKHDLCLCVSSSLSLVIFIHPIFS